MSVETFFADQAGAAPGERPTVLVVEDDLDCRGFLSRLLTRWEYQVHLADSGERSLAWLEKGATKPDLVILDIALGGMSGLDTCRQIRQTPVGRDLPVLFLTGHVDQARYEDAVAAGGDDFLAKPFDPVGLRIRVQALLRLRDLQQQRQRSDEALRQAHEQLERRVEERTVALNQANTALNTQIASREQAQRELEATHRQLLEASRLAGRAEVATGVLHNVGNVLNSINVSASLLSGSAQRSKLPGLLKLSALLRAHEADLATFFTQDPRARQIPLYLEQIAQLLDTEQREMRQEIELIRSRATHIGSIVASQQSYARSAGGSEELAISALIEDALRVQSASNSPQDVEVVRIYQNVPQLCTERHKVLQILINLIHNARQALDESGRADKRLTVEVKTAGERVRVVVGDNGVGIQPENLARIFGHGFTTKATGHGFGLHSSALVARELGGSLSVHSDGPGRGAAFTLELPLTSVQELSAA